MILSALLLGLTPTVFFQEPEEAEWAVVLQKFEELEWKITGSTPAYESDFFQELQHQAENLIEYFKDQGDHEKVHHLQSRLIAALNHLFGALNLRAGKLQEAKTQFQKVLNLREQIVGSNHPSTAVSLTNLAIVLKAQGSYLEALPLLERSLSIQKTLQQGRAIASEQELEVLLESLVTLSSVYYSLAQFDKGKEVCRNTLSMTERAVDPNHPIVATVCSNLAHFLQAQGSHIEAYPLIKRSLAIRKKSLGPEHRDTAASINDFAGYLITQGSYSDARPLFEQSLAILEKSLGSEHPTVALPLNNLAELLKLQGSYAEARPLYERALNMTISHLSKNTGAMTEAERFMFLDSLDGTEPLLLNLVAMQGNGPKKTD